jgi:oligoribonuclease
MPRLNDYLHYRNVDVSTVKELARRWYPDVRPYDKQNSHRALEDIRESIAELRYFRAMLFK